jgi:Ni,Fe-hydrogenase III small subunit/Pyruvate/2-oxoacid:ferredoxin oxidoreductase delta subunit
VFNILRKIVAVGTVTEDWDSAPVPPRFRGAVVADACAACGQCVAICPGRAISLDQGCLTIDNKRCLFCGRCVQVCERQSLSHSAEYRLATLAGDDQAALADAVRLKARRVLGRSLAIRHVDVGSCNACDWEMTTLNNPVYDLQQYGIDFVASPRHADMLMVTGVVTRNLTQALTMTFEATPSPRLVMAVGSCAAGGQTFGPSYAVRGAVDALVPVDIYVPGCPPRPQALLYGLLLALDRL